MLSEFEMLHCNIVEMILMQFLYVNREGRSGQGWEWRPRMQNNVYYKLIL
jgi:hypothetical protein